MCSMRVFTQESSAGVLAPDSLVQWWQHPYGGRGSRGFRLIVNPSYSKTPNLPNFLFLW